MFDLLGGTRDVLLYYLIKSLEITTNNFVIPNYYRNKQQVLYLLILSQPVINFQQFPHKFNHKLFEGKLNKESTIGFKCSRQFE
jgi:hypothetical protein